MNRIGSGDQATRLHTDSGHDDRNDHPRLPHDLAVLVLRHELGGIGVDACRTRAFTSRTNIGHAPLPVKNSAVRNTFGGRWKEISASRPTMIVSVWWR